MSSAYMQEGEKPGIIEDDALIPIETFGRETVPIRYEEGRVENMTIPNLQQLIFNMFLKRIAYYRVAPKPLFQSHEGMPDDCKVMEEMWPENHKEVLDSLILTSPSSPLPSAQWCRRQRYLQSCRLTIVGIETLVNNCIMGWICFGANKKYVWDRVAVYQDRMTFMFWQYN
jgi:hypothetical protein